MPDFLETTIDKFIFRVATDRLYSPDGVWALETGGGRVRIGLTDYLQQRNGDVAFVHVKPVGNLAGPGRRVRGTGDDQGDHEPVFALGRRDRGSQRGPGPEPRDHQPRALTARDGWR